MNAFVFFLSCQKLPNYYEHIHFLPNKEKPGLYDIIGFLVLGIGALLSIYLSIGRSYSLYDGIAMWAPKGYGIALERSLWGARWGEHDYSYPFNIHLLIAIFRLFSGDTLPGSKAIFPLFFYSMVIGLYSFWIKRNVSPLLRLSGLSVLISIPTLFTFSTVGYPNIPMTAYLILATLTGMEGVEDKDRGMQVISGLLFGLTVWTVIEGMLYVAIVILALIFAYKITGTGKLHIAAWLLPVAIIWGCWYIFFLIYGARSSQAMSAGANMLESIRNGNWRWTDIRLILGYARRSLFDISTWGLVYPTGIVISVGGLQYMLPKKSFYGFSLFLVTLLTGVLSLGLFYLRSFEIEGLYDLLQRGFPRGFITPTVLFFLLAVFLASQWLNTGEQEHVSNP
jgi:hypothetical protein